MNQTRLNATVTYRKDLTNALAIVRVTPDNGRLPSFQAGQFCTLGLPINNDVNFASQQTDNKTATVASDRKSQKLVRRAYSIASSANETRFVEIYVALVEEGKLTPNLWTVEKGGRVHMGEKIAGDFTLNGDTSEKNLIMVSTGTGIAPFISMLRTYHGQMRWRRLVLIHGARFAADLGYRNLINRVARRDRTLTYLPTVTREPADSKWSGLRGRVQGLLDATRFYSHTGFELSPKSCNVYLCGNPQMIESISDDLQNRGFTPHHKKLPGNLHFERYW